MNVYDIFMIIFLLDKNKHIVNIEIILYAYEKKRQIFNSFSDVHLSKMPLELVSLIFLLISK